MKKLIKYIPIIGMIILLFSKNDDILPTINNPMDYFSSIIFQAISLTTLTMYFIT